MSANWPVHAVGVIDSTNTEAKRRVAQGFEDQWLIAEQQTAGRGRQNRQWISPVGNVYATALFRETGGLPVALRLPFAAALAVSDVVLEFAPHADVRLKWPNDVRVGGRKISGILVETGGAAHEFWIAAGIGINVLAVPEDIAQPATCLAELGLDRDQHVKDVFAGLRQAFGARLAEARSGFESIRETWLSRAEALGQAVRVRAGDGELEGVFEDLEMDGALALRLPDGARRSIRAGEVDIQRK